MFIFASIENVIFDYAFQNIFKGESETLLREKSVDVCNKLMWRRKPIEKEDIDRKIQARIPQFDGT